MRHYSRDIDNHFTADRLVDKPGFVLDHRSLFPLYFAESLQPAIKNRVRNRDVNSEIAYKITKCTGLSFTDTEEEFNENTSPVCYIRSSEIREEFRLPVPPSTFSFVDILDYIYAVVHSPAYGDQTKEFLKTDRLRIPYPKNGADFWELAKTGSEIRHIHMLKSPIFENITTSYPKQGNNVITKKLTADSPGFVLLDRENKVGRVWINDQQYFDKVTLEVWEFSMGGYQPAQQWLQDRKDSTLSPEDILHYQKIIAALDETQQLLKKAGKI